MDLLVNYLYWVFCPSLVTKWTNLPSPCHADKKYIHLSPSLPPSLPPIMPQWKNTKWVCKHICIILPPVNWFCDCELDLQVYLHDPPSHNASWVTITSLPPSYNGSWKATNWVCKHICIISSMTHGTMQMVGTREAYVYEFV